LKWRRKPPYRPQASNSQISPLKCHCQSLSLTVHLTPARQSQWHLEAPGVGSTFIKLDRRRGGAKELLSQTASLSQLASPGAQAARFCLSVRPTTITPANCKHIVHRLGASLSEQLKLKGGVYFFQTQAVLTHSIEHPKTASDTRAPSDRELWRRVARCTPIYCYAS
jgi:hypothetical protein